MAALAGQRELCQVLVDHGAQIQSANEVQLALFNS